MEQLLSSTRWSIIQSISKGHASATELAKATGSSLPNISQQLKLLEAYDIVEYVKDDRRGVGKPRQLYRLKRPVCQVIFAKNDLAEKLFFHPDGYHNIVMSCFFINRRHDQPYLIKLLLCNEELLQQCSIAYIKGSEKQIELLLITDNLEHIRKNYSNMSIDIAGKQVKIVAWTHSVQEILEGKEKKDQYYLGLTLKPYVIHDPGNLFEKVIS